MTESPRTGHFKIFIHPAPQVLATFAGFATFTSFALRQN
jgi:hypothetical protein